MLDAAQKHSRQKAQAEDEAVHQNPSEPSAHARKTTICMIGA
jgi:hypothetical protein